MTAARVSLLVMTESAALWAIFLAGMSHNFRPPRSRPGGMRCSDPGRLRSPQDQTLSPCRSDRPGRSRHRRSQHKFHRAPLRRRFPQSAKRPEAVGLDRAAAGLCTLLARHRNLPRRSGLSDVRRLQRHRRSVRALFAGAGVFRRLRPVADRISQLRLRPGQKTRRSLPRKTLHFDDSSIPGRQLVGRAHLAGDRADGRTWSARTSRAYQGNQTIWATRQRHSCVWPSPLPQWDIWPAGPSMSCFCSVASRSWRHRAERRCCRSSVQRR